MMKGLLGCVAVIAVGGIWTICSALDSTDYKPGFVYQCEDVDNFTDFRYNLPGKLLLMKIRVPGCLACEVLEPKFNELAAENPKYVFIQVNYMNVWPVLLDYGFTVVPTVLFSLDGNELLRVSTIQKEVVQASLNQAVAKCNFTAPA